MKLLIGPVCFEMITTSDLHTVNKEGQKVALAGNILYDEAKIKVSDTIGPEIQVVTVLHEAIHGMLTQAVIDEHNEKWIEIVALGVYGLIRNNPDLIDAVKAGKFDVPQ